MTRGILAILLPILGLGLLAGWVLWPPAPLPARFAAADCRRVALTDSETGAPIAGAEDLALAGDGETLIVSAQDRLDTAGAEGGLYAVTLPGLGTDAPVMARPLHGARDPALGPFRPHGIALSADGRRLALVNHLSGEAGAIEVGPLGPGGWTPDRQVVDARLCRANDLDFADTPAGAGGLGGDALVVTLDRADCATSIRDLAGGTGRVLALRDGALAVERTGLGFANGIVAAGWVAETRGGRLSHPGGEAIGLPGGPDNLTLAGGLLVVALHPKLVQTGLYLAGWLPRVASRIVAVDPASGAVEVLYDDPGGRLFSGATAAVLSGGLLVAGSAGDTGLLVCAARR